jgi:signal transduction histidine kinase/CheY-like chemotaxis protein
MNARLLRLALDAEPDIVLLRKRTRLIAELLGFDRQDQTRITTAVSEVARNAFEYAGCARAEFRIKEVFGRCAFEIAICDKGPGIRDLQAVLSGTDQSERGLGAGLQGVRRLVDLFDIDAPEGGGAAVRIGKYLPASATPLTPQRLRSVSASLAEDQSADPVEEIRRQNQEMLVQLEELQDKQQALMLLNQELQDTNRGVVALYAELDERADHLRRADELKSKFLSNMSHEFRTPLNSILSLSRLLLSRTDGDLTSEQEIQVQYIRKAAANLTELVNDLLDLAKVRAGKTSVTAVEFTIESLFGSLRGMLRPLLVGDAVALIFEDAADLPTLHSDEAKVSQILRNFLSNAIKYTESGEVRVWAAADANADTVSFHVSDTGIGIAEADLDLIFEEFGQVTHPIQSRIKGTGLGLPLSKKLAELLGGQISVASTPGRGSVFSLTVPRSYRSENIPESIEEQLTIDPARVPVLIVEDDPADAFALQRALAKTRYQPVVARTVAAAERALGLRPAAILLDVLLFGDESWRMILGLRHGEAIADVPIVVISSTGEARKAVHLGADAYLDKPVDPEALVELLDRLTGNRSITRVLIIDDEEVTRYLVRQLLPRGVYDIREATTGAEGLAKLRESRPDIFLLDLKMAGTDGFELLQQIESDPELADLPAIVLTSAILDPDQRQRLRRASRIVSKSDLGAIALTETIAEVLGGNRPLGSST